MDIIKKIRNNKVYIKYSFFIVVFILFIFSITFTILEINLREQGKSNIRNNYYDINMLNATIDAETTSKIKLNNESREISIYIDDLYNFTNGNSFNVELYNIGNIDAYLSDIIITNIDSNIDSNKVEIDLSLEKETVLLASEKKIVNIIVKYNEENPSMEDYINFNIKLSYKEFKK